MQKTTLRSLALAAVSANAFGYGVAAAPSVAAPAPDHAGVTAGTVSFHHENVLGTSLEVKLRASSPEQAARAEAAVLAELDRCNLILSSWRPDSEFSRWAATRGVAVPVSRELMDVLFLFDGWRQETGGALNASAETATQLWQKAALRGRQPSAEELAEAADTMQAPHWRLDRAAGTAVHLDAAPLALNSFAKSYISGRAAEAALAAGAAGVMLNLGGDLVLRGSLSERVAIADPRASAENDLPLDRFAVANMAVATSGGYRRGVQVAGAQYSHLFDPRTAEPVVHVLSATVLAPDPSEAGALATAFAVMQPDKTAALAARLRKVEYLLVLADGRRVASPGWPGQPAPQLPGLVLAAYHPPAKAAPQAMDLLITLELARISDPRYRRPYVSVWIEDKDHFPVKTIALWFQKPRWLPELKSWYRDDQVRMLAENTDLSTTISSATRPPGTYTLRWDGKDNAGKPVKPGRYTVCIEASREHGTHQLAEQEIDFDGRTARQVALPGNTEIAGAALDYGVHAR